MIKLHSVTLEDKAWIDPLVWAEASPSADFNFGNIYLWDSSFHQQVGRCGDRVIVLPCYAHAPFFAWPVGTGELRPVLEELRAYARAHDFVFTMRGVTQAHLPLLEELCPGQFRVEVERPLWDYLYDARKLAELPGKKLHGKRNHIHRFEEEYQWSFAPLTPADYDDCMALVDGWYAQNPEDRDAGSADAADEYSAIRRAFESFGPLGLEGGVLRVSGQAVAFTVGEMVCAHTFVVHFEKARTDINGAYPMVNREFVRQILARHPGVQWINREDDMGLESLRKSKESYHPEAMVEKYMVVMDDG